MSVDKIKNFLEIICLSTFRKITVRGFVNQLIKKFWSYIKVICYFQVKKAIFSKDLPYLPAIFYIKVICYFQGQQSYI